MWLIPDVQLERINFRKLNLFDARDCIELCEQLCTIILLQGLQIIIINRVCMIAYQSLYESVSKFV